MSTHGSGTVPIERLPAGDRSSTLTTAFSAHYEHAPEFYIRVPGRVNLIGEHIDYCGYGVCPMALEQDILLACSEHDDSILRLANLDSAHNMFQSRMEKISISVSASAPEWYQYFLCGVRGILDILPAEVGLKGLNVMVSGTVPQSAGLSSSSALVSAAALATSYAHGLDLSKDKLASICAECERYIGTQGGGMDQAIAFLATKGCAKLINFAPLRSEDVTLPPGAVFVIAHSLTELNKAATADFNCRVIECRFAAQILAKKNGLDWKCVKKLGELQALLKLNLKSMISLVRENLHEEAYNKNEILNVLNATNEELDKISLTENTKHIQSFKLYQRALHVFEEAHRVELFHQECANSTGEASLQILGKLMFESHESLRNLYECSHPQLDRLVELSKGFAFGARLTGAGWGGCVVALVSQDNVHKYMDVIKSKFYGTMQTERKLDTLIFSTEPNSGACIYRCTETLETGDA